MGDQLYLERLVWFDHEARKERYPNAFKLGDHFEISLEIAQRSIDLFRNRLLAPLEYEKSHKGYYYADPTFQLPVIRISEEELLAVLIFRKLITEASAGSLADELGSVSQRLGFLSANLPGRAHPEEAFSLRWKNISRPDPMASSRSLRQRYYRANSSTSVTTPQQKQLHHAHRRTSTNDARIIEI